MLLKHTCNVVILNAQHTGKNSGMCVNTTHLYPGELALIDSAAIRCCHLVNADNTTDVR